MTFDIDANHDLQVGARVKADSSSGISDQHLLNPTRVERKLQDQPEPTTLKIWPIKDIEGNRPIFFVVEKLAMRVCPPKTIWFCFLEPFLECSNI